MGKVLMEGTFPCFHCIHVLCVLQGLGLGVDGNRFDGRDFSSFSLHTCIVCVTGLGAGDILCHASF